MQRALVPLCLFALSLSGCASTQAETVGATSSPEARYGEAAPWIVKLQATADSICKCTTSKCAEEGMSELLAIAKQAGDVELNDEGRTATDKAARQAMECLMASGRKEAQ